MFFCFLFFVILLRLLGKHFSLDCLYLFLITSRYSACLSLIFLWVDNKIWLCSLNYTSCNICIHLLQHNLIKQSEANVLKTIEKRSLLPRMIHLSISSASASVKENIEANGSIADTKFSLDLKILLERYAKILEFPLHDAVELVFGVSSGQKPLEVCSLSFNKFSIIYMLLCSLSFNMSEKSTFTRISHR